MTKPIRIVSDVLSEIMYAPYPAGAYFLMAGTGLAMDRMTQVIFIGIASVTYPTVAVIAMDIG